jgi:predicted CopG family antitoxin
MIYWRLRRIQMRGQNKISSGNPKGRRMQTIEVSEEVYSWLVEHKDYLESEGQQPITFDDVIRDLYEKFHQAVQELDRERTLGR